MGTRYAIVGFMTFGNQMIRKISKRSMSFRTRSQLSERKPASLKYRIGMRHRWGGTAKRTLTTNGGLASLHQTTAVTQPDSRHRRVLGLFPYGRQLLVCAVAIILIPMVTGLLVGLSTGFDESTGGFLTIALIVGVCIGAGILGRGVRRP